MAGFCGQGTEVFLNGTRGIFGLADDMFASQDGLRSIEIFN